MNIQNINKNVCTHVLVKLYIIRCTNISLQPPSETENTYTCLHVKYNNLIYTHLKNQTYSILWTEKQLMLPVLFHTATYKPIIQKHPWCKVKSEATVTFIFCM